MFKSETQINIDQPSATSLNMGTNPGQPFLFTYHIPAGNFATLFRKKALYLCIFDSIFYCSM